MEILRRCLLISLLCLICFEASAATDVSYDHRALVINGERRVLLSGSIHYPRSTPEMWPDLIAKAKDGGLDVIETYVFWNLHEPMQRKYDFEGRLDLVKFLKTVHQAGLFAHLRIGPYVCAEWNYGGFPVWLHSIAGIRLRTNNEPFKKEMQNFTTVIVNMMKEEKLFAWQGGPLILAQIENEFGNEEKFYGAEGKSYINWAAKMALSLNTSVPWVMCQQADAPDPMINTCNGFYCDNFKPNSHKKPKMWTENWTGWFQTFGGRAPHRPSEDVAYSVARFFQRGGTFQNYYMYHGGTNFGRTAGGPFITTSYDYDSPIDEYGNLRQPKWGHLKDLHTAIKLCEHPLTHGRPKSISLGHHLKATVYHVKSSDHCAAFLSNEDTKLDAEVLFNGKSYHLPAWSVSILPDCKNVVFNTAKVSTQTSLMGMKHVSMKSLVSASSSNETAKTSLNWHWHKEHIGSWGNDGFSATGLLEQINTAKDKSDYLWYITSVHVDEDEPFLKKTKQAVLHVKTLGHTLHVFVNGKFAGTHAGSYEMRNFTYEKNITLKAGHNHIALLSMTVGLQNYGPFFDTLKAGINGPVLLKGFRNGTRDLSFQEWLYQVGLKGEHLHLYSDARVKNVTWGSGINPPKKHALIWYKTEFNAPEGNHPVALDLSSMSKGQAWINGQSIGRYWPSYIAPTDGCSKACEYRGAYSPENCVSHCGQPSQKWYHIPRSWLHPTDNVLVLLEELGGDPSGISLRTRHVDIVCGLVSQTTPPPVSSWNLNEKKQPNPELQLQCSSGHHISSIKFASFGNPEGFCGKFHRGDCHARNSSSIVEKACVGRETCTITVSEEIFGNPCADISKSLAVEAVCRRN